MDVELTVDPGKRGCGYAWWTPPGLLCAGYAPGASEGTGPDFWVACARGVAATRPGGTQRVVRVSVETMRIYTTGAARPADLLHLQGVSAAICAWFAAQEGSAVRGIEPAAWKGQVPRKIMGARVEQKIRAAGWWDKVIVPGRATELNDAMHAVGIGLYFRERVDGKGTSG